MNRSARQHDTSTSLTQRSHCPCHLGHFIKPSVTWGLVTPQSNLFSNKPTCIVLTGGQFLMSTWCLISFCLTAVITYLTVAAPINTSSSKQEVLLFFALSPGEPPPPAPPVLNKLSPLQATLHSSWHVFTQTDTHTGVAVPGVSASQHRGSITRGRHYSHNSLASSALTRRRVLPPSIMSRKLQFPHVSYRELWSALIEYS